MGKKILLIILLPFLLTMQEVQDTIPPPLPVCQEDSGRAAMKIVSWNLHLLPTILPFTGSGERARRIAYAVADLDPDIAVFQEAFDQHARKVIRGVLQERYPYQLRPLNNSFHMYRVNSGVWILSKIPLETLGMVRFDDCAGADCLARKGALMVEGSWQQHPFQLIATHLQANEEREVRKGQLRQIQNQLIGQHTADNVPLFLCGDLNADKHQGDEFEEILQQLKVSDGPLEGAVGHTFEDDRNGKMLLDYFLIRNDWANAINIHRTVGLSEGNTGAMLELSDHLPVVATFCF